MTSNPSLRGLTTTGPAEHRSIVQLNKGWQFRQADDPDSVYLETQGFPTEIHLDLLHHGIIQDPFVGKAGE